MDLFVSKTLNVDPFLGAEDLAAAVVDINGREFTSRLLLSQQNADLDVRTLLPAGFELSPQRGPELYTHLGSSNGVPVALASRLRRTHVYLHVTGALHASLPAATATAERAMEALLARVPDEPQVCLSAGGPVPSPVRPDCEHAIHACFGDVVPVRLLAGDADTSADVGAETSSVDVVACGDTVLASVSLSLLVLVPRDAAPAAAAALCREALSRAVALAGFAWRCAGDGPAAIARAASVAAFLPEAAPLSGAATFPAASPVHAPSLAGAQAPPPSSLEQSSVQDPDPLLPAALWGALSAPGAAAAPDAAGRATLRAVHAALGLPSIPLLRPAQALRPFSALLAADRCSDGERGDAEWGAGHDGWRPATGAGVAARVRAAALGNGTTDSASQGSAGDGWGDAFGADVGKGKGKGKSKSKNKGKGKARGTDAAEAARDIRDGPVPTEARSCPVAAVWRAAFDARAWAPVLDAHLCAAPHGLQGGTATTAVVRGHLAYYHYTQGGVRDKGWGCAYRSLQSLASWVILNGYGHPATVDGGAGGAPVPGVPSIADIQRLLAQMGACPSSIVGSSQWIGSQEVGFVLNELYGIEARFLTLSSGREVPERAREIQRHIAEHGTPVMVGGGALALTILGVALDTASGDTRFLILDPHYTGPDDMETICGTTVAMEGYKATGCGWRGPEAFKATSRYNVCLPIRPNTV